MSQQMDTLSLCSEESLIQCLRCGFSVEEVICKCCFERWLLKNPCANEKCPIRLLDDDYVDEHLCVIE